MTTIRTVGQCAGALALAVALAGCGGDDGTDSTLSDDMGSVAGETDDPDDAADQGGDDSADSDADSGGAGDEDGDAAESDDEGSGEAPSLAAPGVYRDYSEDAVADTSYDTTIMFFYASWCPECRAFEQAIESQGVPDGVQILKTDYDNEHDLREQYGITIQSSFVKVDPDGNELSKWFGYGEDKSVDTILEQLG